MTTHVALLPEAYRAEFVKLLDAAITQLTSVFSPDIFGGGGSPNLQFQFDEGGRRGHSKKLYKRRSRLDTRKYVFANRITDLWNSLPYACGPDVVGLPALSA